MSVLDKIIQDLHHRLPVIDHNRIKSVKVRAGIDKYHRLPPGTDQLNRGMSKGSGADDPVNPFQGIPGILKSHGLLLVALLLKHLLNGETDTQIIGIL